SLDTRLAAIYALERIGEGIRGFLPQVIDRLGRATDPIERGRILEVLAGANHAPQLVVPLLVDALLGEDEKLYDSAVDGLLRINNPEQEVAPLIKILLLSNEDQVRQR